MLYCTKTLIIEFDLFSFAESYYHYTIEGNDIYIYGERINGKHKVLQILNFQKDDWFREHFILMESLRKIS